MTESFDAVADRLSLDAVGVSAIRRLKGNADYETIVSMGNKAIPSLLERLELKQSRPLWLAILSDITGAEPLWGKQTVEDGSTAWLQWGRLAGYKR